MSADNWAICPKCRIRAEREKQKLLDKVVESYGKIAQKEWEGLKSNTLYRIEIAEGKTQTLREDYELGVCSNGEFSISYKAHCDRCNLSFNFKHQEMVKLDS